MLLTGLRIERKNWQSSILICYMRTYGENIHYECDLIKPEDYDKLQAFSCKNKQLDKFIHNELIMDGNIYDDDGLPFKYIDKVSGDICAIVSLAASGITFKEGMYTHVLPAVKIDVFAVDEKYQKLHMDKESEQSENKDDHIYFADEIMADVLKRCRNISESMMMIKYVILYADINALRFYERNFFESFSEFMEKENNMEINKNYPMYMEL